MVVDGDGGASVGATVDAIVRVGVSLDKMARQLAETKKKLARVRIGYTVEHHTFPTCGY